MLVGDAGSGPAWRHPTKPEPGPGQGSTKEVEDFQAAGMSAARDAAHPGGQARRPWIPNRRRCRGPRARQLGGMGQRVRAGGGRGQQRATPTATAKHVASVLCAVATWLKIRPEKPITVIVCMVMCYQRGLRITAAMALALTECLAACGSDQSGQSRSTASSSAVTAPGSSARPHRAPVHQSMWRSASISGATWSRSSVARARW